MKYENGEEIKRGDNILIENGKTKGIIYDIIDSLDKQKFWNVNTYGVMIESKPFGLVFWSLDDVDKIKFINRVKRYD